MSGYRLTKTGRVNPDRPLKFRFDGRDYQGLEGDTLASALLANGVTLFGRSFKYHRPRGLMGIGMDEPNALVTLRAGGRSEPNIPATQVELFDGLEAKSQNRFPSLRLDYQMVNRLLSPLLVAGFYYKTFMGPNIKWWRFFEHPIRHAAGLGAAGLEPDPDRYEAENLFCDLLVVGAGPAGLAAAREAAAAGGRVVICDMLPRPGGWLQGGSAEAARWIEAALEDLADLDNVSLMTRTLVYGYYDHNTLGAVERVADHLAAPDEFTPRQRHWTIRAGEVVLATGALERPLIFPGNDRPGVMLASAVRNYAAEFGVAAGRQVALFTNNDSAYETARVLCAAGVLVTAMIDLREDPGDAMRAICADRGIMLLEGHKVVNTAGFGGLSSITAQPVGGGMRFRVPADCLGVSGGWNPNIQLQSQMGSAPIYDPALAAFTAGEPFETWRQTGACTGRFALDDIEDFATDPKNIEPVWEIRAGFGKAFVDMQHDVTNEDIRLAAREGYQSVEHLKRYTTLGMATDQGKTSNVPALAIMANLRGIDITEAGTTRYRPPVSPVTLGALAGREAGHHLQPTRRTPLHDWHVENGAEMLTVGQWMRPRAYLRPGETLEAAYIREMTRVRQGVGMVDVSTLGKIDLQGPDAAEFLNRVYVNGWKTLAVGKARYGVMLREDGFVFDDGTTWRLAERQYLMTTTTANAGPVMAHLERCLAEYWPELKVSLASVTEHWAGMAVSGPVTRLVLEKVLEGVDVGRDAFPHMGVRRGRCAGVPVWVARLSFSGELAFEIYAPAHHGETVWRAIMAAGEHVGITAYGMEALGALRIEKGHVAGPELDGRTTLHDLGLDRMASSKKDFIGCRLMHRPALTDPARPRLVALISQSGERIRAGAHVVASGDPQDPGDSLGHVTSVTYSPMLKQHMALALVANGPDRHGDTLFAADPLRGHHIPVEIASPHIFDPEGRRMHV